MSKPLWMTGAVLLALLQSLHATAIPRRATIVGGGNGSGKCTLEVIVDGSAQVEVWGDAAELRALTGREASWRRFQCTAPMPFSPPDFRLVAAPARGRVALLRNPRNSRGRALVRIDGRAGREHYIFDLQWRAPAGSGPLPVPLPGRGPAPGLPWDRAVQACQDAVTGRVRQFGFPTVVFGRNLPQSDPGRGRIWGTVTGLCPLGSAEFSFACSVDLNTGRVRSVDVQRQ